mmetsp:Transcript_33144/g.94220  ORF Transcript_33144/g.94220 Transcript_33144/m.94220 type:complete len:240 (+) Transcript_33144:319-1038(+)
MARTFRVALRKVVRDVVGYVQRSRGALVPEGAALAEGKLRAGVRGRVVGQRREEHQQEDRQHLHQSGPLLSLVVLMLVSAMPSEEHAEQVLRVDEVAVVVVVPARAGLLLAVRVVDLLLVRVCQALHRLCQLLERLLGTWSFVLVGVQLQGELLVRLLDHVFARVPGHLQDLVVVLHPQNPTNQLGLVDGVVLGLGCHVGARRRCSCSGGPGARSLIASAGTCRGARRRARAAGGGGSG